MYVGNFIGNYAKAYKKIEKGKIKLNTKIEVIEADAIKYRQVGVIDLSGNTIVQPIYDRIDLYMTSASALSCNHLCITKAPKRMIPIASGLFAAISIRTDR